MHLVSKYPTYHLLSTIGNSTFIMERCSRHTHLYTHYAQILNFKEITHFSAICFSQAVIPSNISNSTSNPISNLLPLSLSITGKHPIVVDIVWLIQPIPPLKCIYFPPPICQLYGQCYKISIFIHISYMLVFYFNKINIYKWVKNVSISNIKNYQIAFKWPHNSSWCFHKRYMRLLFFLNLIPTNNRCYCSIIFPFWWNRPN